jgi:teichuronic acid biosynthesis glycosyltransferase TuaG
MITSNPTIPVSIVTPVHNGREYIRATAASILRQSMVDYEWIVVDDGSDRETAEELARLANTDSRIRVITNPVAYGPARARNIGVAAATGEFVAFLDADDIWHMDKLKHQVRFMREHALDFSYHDYIPFEDGNGRAISRIHGPPRLTLFNHNAKRGIGCLAVMVKRDVAGPDVFPLLPAGMVAEDFAAWALLIKAGARTRRLPEALAWYRVRKTSFSSNKVRSAESVWYIMRTLEGFGRIVSAFYLASFLFSTLVYRLRVRFIKPGPTLTGPPWH